MPEKDVLNEERASAEPSAGGSAVGSAQEEWLPTKEAAKVAGTSARTLKRRADLGRLRRTSVHTQFGVEAHYYKDDILKIKSELRQAAEGLADGIAEVSAELGGRHAEGADGKSAELSGGDRRSLSLADPAEVGKVFAQSLTKLTEPFFRLADVLERGFQAQTRMIESRYKIEERRFRAERVKNIVWPVLVMILVGGIYYGFARMAGYYKEELRVRGEELGFREKEIGLLDGVYNRALEKYEKEVERRNEEIKRLKEEISGQDAVSTETEGE